MRCSGSVGFPTTGRIKKEDLWQNSGAVCPPKSLPSPKKPTRFYVLFFRQALYRLLLHSLLPEGWFSLLSPHLASLSAPRSTSASGLPTFYRCFIYGNRAMHYTTIRNPPAHLPDKAQKTLQHAAEVPRGAEREHRSRDNGVFSRPSATSSATFCIDYCDMTVHP